MSMEDTEKTIDELPSVPTTEGTDATAPEAVSGTEAAVAEPTSWLTDEYKELASSYGMGDDEVQEFSSAAEFTRATRLLDKQLADFAMRQVQETAKTETAPVAPAQATEAQVANAEKFGKLEHLDLTKLKAAGYDEDSLQLFSKQNEAIDRHNALVEHLEKRAAQEKVFEERFGKLEQGFQQFQEAIWQHENQRRLQTFHTSVDSLNDERFGKTVTEDGRPLQLTQAQNQARQKLLETTAMLVEAHTLRQQTAGRPVEVPPLNAMLRRANQYAFSEDIRAEERKRVQQEIAEQAKRRRPVATGRGPNGQFVAPDKHIPLSSPEYVEGLLKNPEVEAAWNKALESAGAA